MTSRSCLLPTLLVGLGLAASPGQALAQVVPASPAAAERQPLQPTPPPAPAAGKSSDPTKPRPIRSGTMLSLSLDTGLGSASGYPNDSKLKNDANFYGRTGPIPGRGFTVNFGGAIAEYLNVGFYFATHTYSGNDWRIKSGGGGIRIDAFPFTYVHNKWLRSWAFYGIAGLGAVDVHYSKPGSNVADLDGTQSNLGVGSFYEFRFGAFGLGPDSRFDAVVSRTASRVAFNLGLRLSFYPSRLF